MPRQILCPIGRNNLIATLSDGDRALIEPHLTQIALPKRLVLEEANGPIDTVYFPVAGIGSIVAKDSTGRGMEVGLFGREGMSGTAVVMESDYSIHQTFMQVAGHGLSIKAGVLYDLVQKHATMRHHFLRYTQALMAQTDHTALSNGRAKLEERLARWLLMCHDRIGGDTIELTHEFLSIMLGVRRAGVTVGTHMLEGKGLIRASRGRITILNREGLEAAASLSYGLPEAEYTRLIGWAGAD